MKMNKLLSPISYVGLILTVCLLISKFLLPYIPQTYISLENLKDLPLVLVFSGVWIYGFICMVGWLSWLVAYIVNADITEHTTTKISKETLKKAFDFIGLFYYTFFGLILLKAFIFTEMLWFIVLLPIICIGTIMAIINIILYVLIKK